MTWFNSVFNAWLGSNITYVYNAYSKSEDEYIWISRESDDLVLKNISAKIELAKSKVGEAKVGGSLEVIFQQEGKESWARIPYRQPHQQRRKQSWECMTIYSHDGKLLCSKYEIAANRSFIVTRLGGIVPQKYGGALSVDEYGHDHS